MSGSSHTYAVLDLFSSDRYQGDQLSVVRVGNVPIAPAKEQKIAQEFNFVTTAFLHDTESTSQPLVYGVDLYSPRYEHLFSARALFGVAHYVFRALEGTEKEKAKQFRQCILRTKYAEIQARFDPTRQIAAIEIPHDCHVHGIETTKDEVLAVQRGLVSHPQALKMKASYPIFSLSRGFTYTLVDMTETPALMQRLTPSEAPDPDLDEDWKFSPEKPGTAVIGAVYFVQLQTDFTEEPFITRLSIRSIKNKKEEAASASACCAVAAYLALQKPDILRHAYAFEQGQHVGRNCQLCVDVQLEPSGREIANITLSGRAVFSMEGKLL
ncbi:Phenazine biosynthesis PhzC/PhzF protein [Ascosphaera apis ARSEF 7405]|uniref:Phenazine biosynthesis PhzC/PhzF protein n=1 Tax=Ascosphaera apis ARSEF 7405 TaxID=392613 RepID=A0A167ZHT7_9EURO|nr:Phenazine biosynthesis PhzC/PhzF protein [Ascosphaera apis ARSEF 7405]